MVTGTPLSPNTEFNKHAKTILYTKLKPIPLVRAARGQLNNLSMSDPGAKLSIDEVERRLLKNLAAKYDDTKCEASSLDLIKMTKNR